MYSIQLQMAELGELKHGMHTCPHPASQTLILFLIVVFCTRVGFKKYNMVMVSSFNKHSWPGKC